MTLLVQAQIIITRIRQNDYRGQNADVLREMDLNELESLIHHAEEKVEDALDRLDILEQEIQVKLK